MKHKPNPKTWQVDIGLILLVLITRFLVAGQYLHKWDSVQFALALTDFDISRHQPHPPGYPGYIWFSKFIYFFTHDENSALIITGVFFTVLMVIAIHRLGLALLGPRGGAFAGLLAVLNPLLWYFSSIALAYIPGVSLAMLAVWASITAKGRTRILSPVLAGLASVFWAPAGILAFPVCIWGYLQQPENGDENESFSPVTGVIQFTGFFILMLILGYVPIIQQTGGLGPFLAEIQSESGKHVIRFSEWVRNPISEFLATTGALNGFFIQTMGMGRWLLVALLVPILGEAGCAPKKVAGLLPLAIAGYVAIHWVDEPVTHMAGILIFIFATLNLVPKPFDAFGLLRKRLFMWWLIPGLLLFVLVFVNYVGIFTLFIPGLILLEAWCIERASEFMTLQTIREESKPVSDNGEENGEGTEVQLVKTEPDRRVGLLVAWALLLLVALNDIGGFLDESKHESWVGILARDVYVHDVIEAVDESPVPRDQLIILGGTDDYRHWTYYLPESTSIWISSDRVQNKTNLETFHLDGDDSPLAAIYPLDGSQGIIVFPEEMDKFIGNVEITGLGYELMEPVDGEPVPLCYLVEPGDLTKIVFSDGVWWLE